MRSMYECTHEELRATLQAWGEPSFRATQVWQWIWQKGCTDFSLMTNVKKELRQRLQETYSLDLPEIQAQATAADGTIKGLLSLHDACSVEWVLIPDRDHYTLCLSTQVGCRLGCTFCSTGRMGFVRNMSSGEILSQVLVAQGVLNQNKAGWPLRNIVFMGMGEPLLNWPQVHKSLQVLRDPLGCGFSHRRVTVSTVGIPKTLERFAQTGLASLALSLHAPTQGLRLRLMPRAARLLSLPELISRLQRLPLKPRQRITIEYILLGGINDGLSQAKELNRLLSRVKCKINLISYNPSPDLAYRAPTQEAILTFEKYLWDKGQTVILRKSKGQDIQAACGQLHNSLAASTT
mgnify:CR=1 FL=1